MFWQHKAVGYLCSSTATSFSQVNDIIRKRNCCIAQVALIVTSLILENDTHHHHVLYFKGRLWLWQITNLFCHLPSEWTWPGWFLLISCPVVYIDVFFSFFFCFFSQYTFNYNNLSEPSCPYRTPALKYLLPFIFHFICPSPPPLKVITTTHTIQDILILSKLIM